MELSVIVPVYNMAGWDKLRWCMDSLVNQTLRDKMEIIAVDDCSTDDSPKILREYESRYPGLVKVILSMKNMKQGGAKNLGLRVACGEWIGFVDADDWVTPDYYERLIKAAEDAGADMAGCDYSLVDSHTWEPGRRVANNSLEQTGRLDEEKHKLLLLDSGSLVTKVYRRSIVYGKCEDGKVFPEGIFYEDNAVSALWMLRAKSFAYIPEPLYFYYQHGDSTVHSISMSNLRDRMKAALRMLRSLKDEGLLEEYEKEIEFTFTDLFYRNTLFSAMAQYRGKKGAKVIRTGNDESIYRFTKRLSKKMRDTFPDFEKNPYYRKRIDREERGFMHLQGRSQILFFLKYCILWWKRGWL